MSWIMLAFRGTGRRALFLALAVAVFFATPTTPASAQSTPSASSLFSMSTPDAPIQWLQNLIQGTNAPTTETFLGACSSGGTAPCNNNASGDIQTGLLQVLSWYSYAMLVLGSFLLLYYLVRIIAETAHTGRPGGKANQLWAPIRTVLAIGLLVPITTTGLNSGQMIVLNIASEGSALASNTWTLFVSAIASSIGGSAANVLTSPASKSAQDQAIDNMFLTYVCAEVFNQTMAQASPSVFSAFHPTLWQINETPTPTTTTNPNGVTVTQTTLYGNGVDSVLCGQTQVIQPSSAVGGSVPINGIANGLTMDIFSAEASAFQNAQNSVKNYAQQYVTSILANQTPTVNAATIQAVAQQYNQDMASGVSSNLSTVQSELLTAFQDDAKTLGWLSAGSLYLGVARVQTALAQAMEYAPSVQGPDVTAWQDLSQGKPITNPNGSYASSGAFLGGAPEPPPDPLTLRTLNTINGAQAMVTVQPGGSASAPTEFTLESAQAAAGAGPQVNTGGFLNIVNKITTAVQKEFSSTVGSPGATPSWMGTMVPVGGFPIADLSTLGSNLLRMAGAIWSIGTFAGVFSGAAGSLLVLIGMFFFAPGIALAYVLPLLPFIHFLFAILGWLLHLADAVIEVPIFALAHLDPEGEGVLPQVTHNGYRLLLQLILRPLLIVIGLILSILLMNGLVDFLNLVFSTTVMGTMNGSSLDYFSEMVYTIIYAALVYSICNSCFKAIDYIPNHALRWIGGQGDMHDSSVHHGNVLAATTAAASASQQLGQSLGNLGTTFRQNRLMKQQKAAAKAQETHYKSLDDGTTLEGPGIAKNSGQESNS